MDDPKISFIVMGVPYERNHALSFVIYRFTVPRRENSLGWMSKMKNMSTTSSIANTADRRTGPPDPLEWESWPLRDRVPWPLRGDLRSGPTPADFDAWAPYVLLAAAAWLGWLIGEWQWMLGAIVVMAICLWRWLIPIYLEINSQGVTVKILGRRRRISWRSVVGYEVGLYGLVLFAHTDIPILGRLKSLYIPFDEERRIVTLVDYYARPPSLD